jgi:hypothetical protein
VALSIGLQREIKTKRKMTEGLCVVVLIRDYSRLLLLPVPQEMHGITGDNDDWSIFASESLKSDRHEVAIGAVKAPVCLRQRTRGRQIVSVVVGRSLSFCAHGSSVDALGGVCEEPKPEG